MLFQSRAGFSECLDAARHMAGCGGRAFQSRAGFSECLDLTASIRITRTNSSFNPVLGFLSVSTVRRTRHEGVNAAFQSRAGFSECLDHIHIAVFVDGKISFNPVLGFLSVSTYEERNEPNRGSRFQSRAGFSECLDTATPSRSTSAYAVSIPCWVF